MDRAGTAAAAARCGRRRRARSRASRRDPVPAPAEHQRAVGHARLPAVVVRRRRVGRAVERRRSPSCSSRSPSAPRSSGCRAARRPSCRWSSRSASSSTWIPLEQWKHSFPQLSKSALAQGIGRTDNSWIDRAVGRNARRGGALVGRERAVRAGRTSSGTAASTASTASARRCRATCRMCASPPTGRPACSSAWAAGRSPTRTCSRATPSTLVGKVVARDPAKQLRLYRVTSPARITTIVTGLYPTSAGVSPWSNPNPAWTRLAVRRRHAHRRRLERHPAVQGRAADDLRHRDDTRADDPDLAEHRPPPARLPARAAARRLPRRLRHLARAPADRPCEGLARTRACSASTSTRSGTRRPREDRRRRVAAVARAHGRRQLHPRLAGRDRRGVGGSGRGRRVRAGERPREA